MVANKALVLLSWCKIEIETICNSDKNHSINSMVQITQNHAIPFLSSAMGVARNADAHAMTMTPVVRTTSSALPCHTRQGKKYKVVINDDKDKGEEKGSAQRGLKNWYHRHQETSSNSTMKYQYISALKAEEK
jgi:hypothetical protein